MIYYQIIEVYNPNTEVTTYNVRRARNFFGYICSPIGSDRWVSSSGMYTHRFYEAAGQFNTIERAREAAQWNAEKLIKESRIKKPKLQICEVVSIIETT